MTHRFADLTFTDSVRNARASCGSRASYTRMPERAGPNDRLDQHEANFLAVRDSFNLASVSATWCQTPALKRGV